MGKVTTVLFKAAHVEVAEIRPHEKEGILNTADVQAQLEALEKVTNAITIIYEGRIMGFAGYLTARPGVAEVWLIPTIYLAQASHSVAIMLKRYVSKIAQAHKFHRLQTAAPDDPLHWRWMTFLEFQHEGCLRRYGVNQQDYIQWARLFKWD